MKNKLQYAYSITVFIGVLFTAYLMMNRDGSGHVPLRAMQSPAMRTDAQFLDPGVNQLFEVEDALSKLPKYKDRSEDKKRVPTQLRSKD